MDKKILVAYATNAGSTKDVATTIGEQLSQNSVRADVRGVWEVNDIDAYDAVVVGGPVIMGWHRSALDFLRKHQDSLSQVPVAYFLTAMRLTKAPDADLETVSVYQDESLAIAPRSPGKPTMKEKHATAAAYLEPALTAAPRIKPVGAAIFGGKLDYAKLSIFQKLFVRLIIGAQPGDRRNWPAIREWASNARPDLVRRSAPSIGTHGRQGRVGGSHAVM